MISIFPLAQDSAESAAKPPFEVDEKAHFAVLILNEDDTVDD
jgi:hypothetical protein